MFLEATLLTIPDGLDVLTVRTFEAELEQSSPELALDGLSAALSSERMFAREDVMDVVGRLVRATA